MLIYLSRMIEDSFNEKIYIKIRILFFDIKIIKYTLLFILKMVYYNHKI